MTYCSQTRQAGVHHRGWDGEHLVQEADAVLLALAQADDAAGAHADARVPHVAQRLESVLPGAETAIAQTQVVHDGWRSAGSKIMARSWLALVWTGEERRFCH